MVMRAIRSIPGGAVTFFHRQSIMPYQAGIAALSIIMGVFSFFDWTLAAMLFNNALPMGGVLGFNLMYVVSGFAMFFGMGWGYRNLESFGLILLLTVLIARVIVVFAAVGLTPITTSTIVQGAVIGFSTLVRLVMLVKGHDVVLIRNASRVEVETEKND